ncbi:MAG TPA: HAD-IIA family hydrolase [Marmoricola sp.]|jgi:HAD superfamily hydrolase (TIGR01450 family)|nr:HAD-IIA family hydrolase [Marmoricola sp.]
MTETASDPLPLSAAYDVAVLDLDGVVYVGADAVHGAVTGLREARDAGMQLAFVTNNASRPPSDVAVHLTAIGIPADPADVVTSAQAAAGLMAAEVPAGSTVFVIGGPGLHEALRERGLEPTIDTGDEAVGVVQGFGPDMPWRQVIDGALLVREGLPWIASNTDLTVPTKRGPGPGNGTLVRLVADFAGREPRVAGKPQPPLFEETLARVGGEHPLVVGDRIDTDIEGAIAVGWDSLLVMSGVTGLADLASLAPELRPTYVGAHLGCLGTAMRPVVAQEQKVTVEGWTASVTEGRLVVTGDGDVHAWWRAVAAALWGYLDSAGRPAATDRAEPGSVVP